MKNVKGVVFCLLVFLLTTNQASAQKDSLPQDPLLKYKYFFELGVSVNATRVNTNHVQFDTPNGPMEFRKNHYLPTMDAMFMIGRIFKDREKGTTSYVKTGLNLVNRTAEVNDSLSNPLRLNTSYIQIPLQFGFRMPLKYNTERRGMFRAIDLNGGVYLATPIMQRLHTRNDIDSDWNGVFASYLRAGIIGEIAFTSFNEKGHGHRFGIRTTSDFRAIGKISDTDTELYPYYYTLGIFYNLSNNYK